MDRKFNCDAIPSNSLVALYNERMLERCEAEERGGYFSNEIFKRTRPKKPPVLTITNAFGESIFSIEKDAA